MSKKRDAASGKYISEEESKEKDKSTWVTEKDHPTMDDRTHLLMSLYTGILSKKFVTDEEKLAVFVDDIDLMFKSVGLDVNKLKEQGLIS
jgi:hypothetical protein